MYSSSAAVKQARIMQEIAGSNLVCTILNPVFYWYIPAHTSTYGYNTAHTGTTQYILV